MAVSVSRLTLYALIAAIEEDLRETLATFACSGTTTEFFGPALLQKLVYRFEADTSQDPAAATSVDLLQYCDYGDAIQLCRSHRRSLPESFNTQLKTLDSQLSTLIGIRNRVMHSRPLEFDDLANTTDLAQSLLVERSNWKHLQETKNQLSASPEFVLTLTIPFETRSTSISNNLPLPDFDETGFIGRKTTVSNLKKALLGVYPVVTIVGEGGLGKTSLALKVAYDLLDDAESQFDAITFVSAKTQKLTETEIQRIRGAINTSVGLFEDAAKSLGGNEGGTIDELVELLTEFRVLLIIDNLETVLDDRIRELMERLPAGSKILITTRIRMGAFEYPLQLEPLQPSEAAQLLRATAKVRECSRLVGMSDGRLIEYCKRMRNNPLHIKWFVSAVQSGQRPEAVLADERLFLQFCLSNVFNVVSESARRLTRALLSLGGGYTVAELAFLTGMDQPTLLKAIEELTRTNMFFATSSPVDRTFETKYELSQLARAYLTRFYPVAKEEQQRLLLHKKRLISGGEQIQSESKRSPLHFSSIHCRNRSDWVIARLLRQALTEVRGDRFASGLAMIEQAKALAPDFSEVFRIEGFAHARAGNITSAYECYERALELAPESALTHMLFGGFLLRDIHDNEGALEQFSRAMQICPEEKDPCIEFVRCCLYLRRFDEADEKLKELEALNDLHELTAKKLVDLRLQLYIRKADYFVSTHEPLKALVEMQMARSFFNQIQNPDSKMVGRFSKMRVTAAQTKSALGLHHERFGEALEILNWIDSDPSLRQAGKAQEEPAKTANLDLTSSGYISKLFRDKNFGFIKQDADGKELFFDLRKLQTFPLSRLTIGARVQYEVLFDWRGRIFATKLRYVGG